MSTLDTSTTSTDVAQVDTAPADPASGNGRGDHPSLAQRAARGKAARSEVPRGAHAGPDCGHEPVPHGDHVDYLVAGHLHHPHGDHCDDHGPVEVVGQD